MDDDATEEDILHGLLQLVVVRGIPTHRVLPSTQGPVPPRIGHLGLGRRFRPLLLPVLHRDGLPEEIRRQRHSLISLKSQNTSRFSPNLRRIIVTLLWCLFYNWIVF